MRPVPVESTTEFGDFPHSLVHDDGMEAVLSFWEMEPEDWETWGRGQQLIMLAQYPDGTVKMGPTDQRKLDTEPIR